MIILCHCGAPGSRDDQWVLTRTNLYRFWKQYLPNGRYLFGDSGFTLREWLMVKFSRDQMRKTVNQATRVLRGLFNRDQMSTRACIEQAIGLLKGRFKILRRGMTCDLHHVERTVRACVVLHNICIAKRDVWTPNSAAEQADVHDNLDIGLEPPEWLEFDPTLPSPAAPRTSTVDGPAHNKRNKLVHDPRANRR